MRVQLWSYNYDPEPQGIAPLSAMLAQGLQALGHDVLVVAAHPHYPEPTWGVRLRPYRERRDGIPILRLPLWAGRDSSLARIRQELTFAAAQTAVTPLLPPTDVVIAVTPSFPALGTAMAFAQARRVPWVMWLQDIVTDGAATTGELRSGGPLLQAARSFERVTYRSAASIIVISEAFRQNLLAKGVPNDKIERIFNPSSRHADTPADIPALLDDTPRVLAMGNIGHSQGLGAMVEAFQDHAGLRELGAELVIAGSGVAADDVRAKITDPRVQMPGVFYGDELTPVLRSASIGLVSQRPDMTEFNLPSKLMNYMAFGIPVIASVSPESETARIVRESGAGWVTDAAHPEQFANVAAEVIRDREALERASQAGFRFAREQFAPHSVASRFSDVLANVTGLAPRDDSPTMSGNVAGTPSAIPVT
ncbi:MAG: glycosyltransferase family 4 protein [Solirubrobacteraceae bacterium]|nr:glycosyltransferase family 4 protein [Solirubrobacteraceae bacterium]